MSVTRESGISDADGAVAQVDVAGVAAVAYDHFDSRAGDPQLHAHVVVANKVLTVMDGRWRSLDGRPVFASRTGLSAHYDGLLRLGTEPTGWSQSVIGREGDFLTAEDVPLAAIEAIGAEVVASVSVKRAVWTHWNLMAEATKQMMDLRFATTEDREAVVGLIVDAAHTPWSWRSRSSP